MIEDLYDQPFPIIDIDDEFYLREQEVSDSKAFLDYYGKSEVTHFILATAPKTLPEASSEIYYCRNLFYFKQGIYWTLARKSDDQMIGAIGLYINNQHVRGEVCYDLAPEYWKKGIMTKAVSKVIDYVFEKINLFRVEALTVQNNLGSIRLLQKLGFHHEGQLRKYRYFEGKAHDVEMYALTFEEWKSLKS